MKFNNLKDIQKYVEEISPAYLTGDDVGKVLRKTMRITVRETVYDYYRPKKYQRRRRSGGLSDINHMQWTHMSVSNHTVRLLFENLTPAQNHQIPIYGYYVDSLNGYYISDVIETGGEIEDWYRYGGKWSHPRPFVANTIKKIKQNPKELVNGVKLAYKRAGFDVKW